MEFRDNVKNLRKEFFEVVKEYYNTSNLILKMICNNGIYRDLSAVDMAFRTCMLSSLSDKNIKKLYNKDMERAIHNLRVRGVACIYVVDDIDRMINCYVDMGDRYTKLIKSLKHIKDNLQVLTRESIKLSDLMALQYGYPKFDASKFGFDDMEFEDKVNPIHKYIK